MKKTPIVSAIILLTLLGCKKSEQILVPNADQVSRNGHGKPSPSGEIPYVTGLTVTAISPNSAVLTWNAPIGATSANAYTIVRAVNLSNDFSQWLMIIPYTTYTDNSLQPNTYYSYKVSATQNLITGPYCDPVTILTPQ